MRPKLLTLAVAASALLAACGSGSKSTSTTSSATSGTSGSSGSGAIVKSASNAQLGHTILVNAEGMTLYHLSGEASGKFICTSSCVAVWHPMTVSSGAQPTSTVGTLSVVKRPEGTEQVAYNGMPLYTFTQDKAAGEVNGQGIKDVGTWSVVVVSGTAPKSASGSSAPAEPHGTVGY